MKSDWNRPATRRATSLLLVLVGAVAGCASPASNDGGREASTDARANETGLEASTPDASVDAHLDAAADARRDSAAEASTPDAGPDALAEAGDDAADASVEDAADASDATIPDDASDASDASTPDDASDASTPDDAADAGPDAADASPDADDASDAADASDASDAGDASDADASDVIVADVPPPECITGSDCAGSDTECSMRTCTLGVCGVSFTAVNTPVSTQTAGNCQRNVCNGAGGTTNVPDNADLPVDGNQCTQDVCTAGVPSNPPTGSGSLCTAGGSVCNGAGLCVGCIGAGDCPGSDTACGSRTCAAGVCGRSNIASGTPVGTQSSGDCHRNQCDGSGGMVNAVDDTDVPADGNPCTADVCTAGVPSNPPSASGTACNSGGGTLCNGAGSCVACNAATDCSGSDTVCGSRTCISGVCGRSNVASGTPVGTQTPGDCHRNQCDGAGNTANVVDNSDLPVDGNACTSDVCAGGVPSNPPTPVNSPCGAGGAGLCNGAGTCQQCTAPTQCPGTDTECQMRSCNAGVCGFDNAPSGTVTTAQTSGDCRQNQCNGTGNVMAAANDTDVPNDGNQCTSDVCTAGVPSNPPAASGTVCTMGGGTVCDGAGSCVSCRTSADCVGGGACTSGTCAAPSCTDGLRNGTESAIDCGGLCGPCGVGLHCSASTDCVSGSCSAGNVCEYTLAVLRVGDGLTALTSGATAVSVEYYSLSGTLLRTVAMPLLTVGANHRFTLSGTSTAEGALSASSNGRYNVLAGYDAAAGTASIAGTTAAANPRVVGLVDRSGNVDTSTSMGTLFSAGNPRGAASSDGTSVWAVGSTSGAAYATLGSSAPTVISTTFTNLRTANIYGGQLYVSGSSGTLQGVATVGAGLPTTSGQTITELPGMPTASGPSNYGFTLPGVDTLGITALYVADDRTTGAGGVQRWSLRAGTWVLDYTLSVGTSLGARGVVAINNGGVFTIVATTTASTVVSMVDTGAASSPAVIVAARSNVALRGMAFAPYAP